MLKKKYFFLNYFRIYLLYIKVELYFVSYLNFFLLNLLDLQFYYSFYR